MTGAVAAPSASPGNRGMSDRYRSLDGLRAVSILMVLLEHLGWPWSRRWLDLGVGDYGHLGVVMFFVISGFLITSLLMTEHERNGRVSLKLFYARRALRIFPAAYVYILCVFLLTQAGVSHVAPAEFGFALSYTVNFLPNPSWEIGHLWSLSIEEQFYLLWPFAFAYLALQRSTRLAVAVMFLGPLARAMALVFLRDTPYADLPMFPMQADSLAAGCLLAIWRSQLEEKAWYVRLLRPGFSIFILLVVLVTNRLTGYGLIEVFGRSVENVGLALLVHRSVSYSRDPAGRFLNWGPVAYLGQLSYSFYVWQELFLNRHSTAWQTMFPQNVLLCISTALASYYLLEKPILSLRRRLRAP